MIANEKHETESMLKYKNKRFLKSGMIGYVYITRQLPSEKMYVNEANFYCVFFLILFRKTVTKEVLDIYMMSY